MTAGAMVSQSYDYQTGEEVETHIPGITALGSQYNLQLEYISSHDLQRSQ